MTPPAPVDRERWTRELMRCLDQLEEVAQEQKAQAATFRATKEQLHGQIAHWRALLRGSKGEQTELPIEAPKKEAH